ncbi:UDP-N-acetylmuramate dehydrogenase [Helcococcus sueciensis]|uniref:UDP-N-acetylmuramate dehydrogenase n=1 Tax=Helcococcus sueciensis TaxID=241555 RepID=UPI00040DB636|nr:UDP-N-acetylmuramate dehydrogenase [Helcococcus sueciensis]
MYLDILNKLKENGIVKIKENVLMRDYTTMKIGGPADVLIEPNSIDQIQKIINIAKETNTPLTIIGNGSNLLVRDKGIRGIVVVLKDEFSQITVKENMLTAQSGATLRAAAIESFEKKLTGMEAVSGIPGTVGGAIIMNAGAYGTEMKDIVKNVVCIDRDGNIQNFNNEEMDFSYRHSTASEKDLIVLEVSFELKPGKYEKIIEDFKEYDNKRSSRQPLDKNSAGSTFKRPEGYFASKLIDDAGLRGYRVGNAMVSEKHAGFLINIEDSTCENMLHLIEDVQKRVYDKYKVKLEREVKLIGEE